MSKTGNTSVTPRLGATVLYTLAERDVTAIVGSRRQAGLAAARGNDPREGDTYPAVIVRDWANDPATQQEMREAISSGKFLPAKFRGRNQDGPGEIYDWDTLSKMGLADEAEALLNQQLTAYNRSQLQARVNLQVMLDGNDTHWVTSASLYDPELHDRDADTKHGGNLIVDVESGRVGEAPKIPGSGRRGHFEYRVQDQPLHWQIRRREAHGYAEEKERQRRYSELVNREREHMGWPKVDPETLTVLRTEEAPTATGTTADAVDVSIVSPEEFDAK